ncbi:MAG: UDP-N-acetylglucosamine 1-carboxyvinyltransferase [Nitrospirota bacterium]|nr:UDP-N-acetylglucosamine 1-carboxyvinyltransferase [Nitrospirota bacterium]MDH4359335.1 UDP-N-acetylglucosamine 1-carboxyvinyltransferase [Nitrospirota bacterium]MDH5575967.1 UDP-N-acetylglucosamine 1-carboxyvinyltransferase [Nitrospirota bacterium]
MDQIRITGGVALRGSVEIGGAKNAALPILAAALLGGGECVIDHVPQVRDVVTMRKLLALLGVKVQEEGARVRLDAAQVQSIEAPYDLVKTMRASILSLGPLLTRLGEAKVSLPGGCAIGTRPVNLHLKGLELMGAEIQVEHGYIHAKAARLKGARIDLDFPTVTGTENLIMAACLAEGTTSLHNVAREPEITDLCAFLTKRGAKIIGVGTDTITIEGVKELHGAGHWVIPDRVEAGTYLMAGAITGGDVMVKGCVTDHLGSVLKKVQEMGVELTESSDGVRIRRSGPLKAVEVKTLPYPGFPTDLQAQMMALMSVAQGTSVISETIFEGRFLHVPELHRMGASIEVEGPHAVVKGVPLLTGAPVMASDLRASAGLVLAGLAADGETTLSRVYHLDRGYERLEEKFQALGAKIERVREVA